LNVSPNQNIHFVYFEPLGWSQDWKNTQGAVQLHYYLWQFQAYFEGRFLHQQIQFDLIHHVTYVKYWSPSLLSLLPIPFIWGPVGGGEAAPRSFWKDFSLRGQVYEHLRYLAQRLGEWDPFTRLTGKRSSFALATTQETSKRLQLFQPKRLEIVSQVGLSPDEINHFSQCLPSKGKPTRFVSIGRLLHWKGIHLGLRGFAIAQLEEAEYWIIGDGPERKRLEDLTERLGLSTKVRFLGQITRSTLPSYLEQCQVLVHPSLHDSGGQVCLEMMAAGRPVICLDSGGPALQVTEETGIKVPVENPEQAIQGLANAMSLLATNPALRNQMGQAGQQRVRNCFSWEVKGKFYSQLYQNILAANPKKQILTR
jgi:glycosyltransferase involved in cell wall biosynthesis